MDDLSLVSYVKTTIVKNCLNIYMKSVIMKLVRPYRWIYVLYIAMMQGDCSSKGFVNGKLCTFT